MMVKKIVTSALVISLSSLGIILIAGLFLPTSIIGRIMGSDTTDSAVPTLATTNDSAKIATTNSQDDDSKSEDTSDDDKTTAEDEKSSTPPSTSPTASPDTRTNTPTSPPSTTAPIKQAPTPNPTPAPTPTPTPAPAPAPGCGSGGNCTTAQVAAHNTQANCWVIYSNKVYNVTGFVSRHPGGRQVFNSNTCGRDISQYLSGTREPTSGSQFRHSSGDISDINPYYVANLG